MTYEDRAGRLLRSPVLAWTVCTAAVAWVCAPLWSGDNRVGDTAFTLVWMRHLGHFGSWVDGPAARPMERSIAQNDWVLGEGVLLRPFEWLGAWNAHDAVVILGLLLTTLLFQRLAAAMLGEGPHTWLAAMLGGLNPLQTLHAAHANLVHHEWTALTALLVGAGGLTRRPWLAFAGGVVAAGSFHFGFYIGLHTALAFGLALLVCGLRMAVPALVGAGLMGISVLPVYQIYHDASVDWGAHISVAERIRESWDPAGSLRPQPTAVLHRWFAEAEGEIAPNPGYVAIFLGFIGLISARGRAEKVVVLSVVVAGALALGPEVHMGGPTGMPGPDVLLPLGETREPIRWLAVAFGGIGILAARAVRSHPVLALLLALPVALELSVVRPTGDSVELPAIYDAIPAGPEVLYDAALVQQRACGCGAVHALLGAWTHRHPLLGGVFARPTREGRELTRTAARWPEDVAAGLFRRADVRVTVEHPPLAPRTRGACEEIEEHRLCWLPEWTSEP